MPACFSCDDRLLKWGQTIDLSNKTRPVNEWMDESHHASVHPPPSVITTDSEPSSLPVKRLLRHSDLENLTTFQTRFARTRHSSEQTNAMMDNIMSLNTTVPTQNYIGPNGSEPQSPRRSFTSTKKWPLQDGRLQVTTINPSTQTCTFIDTTSHIK